MTNSYVTFGRRCDFGNVPNAGPWHNHIPLLGHEHWMFASNTKKLNGREYTYPNGTAELDTGASGVILLDALMTPFCLFGIGAAFCYVDNNFVDDYYSQIPGFTKEGLGSFGREYYLIPVTVNATPRVEFDIGGQMFTLERSHLPQAATRTIGSIKYYFGAVQPKSLLVSDGGAYNGPDLIGRVSTILSLPTSCRSACHWPTTLTD